MLIDLPILESIRDHQSQHGLKYEDHRQYRSYCSRRLHRIRRSLNVAQGIPPSAKARHQRGRKLMDISNSIVLEAAEKDQEYGERVLIIPLCLAERAWSYAMQLKQELTGDRDRRRYHLVRRLKKASEHAQRFQRLCNDPESPCSDRTKEEATAYAAYITGLYQYQRQTMEEAKDNLSKALSIYFKLSLSIKKEQVLEHYKQRISELRAYINFCMTSLGETKAKVKVQVPPMMQFHDIAFKHARQLVAEQETVQASPKKPTEATPDSTEAPKEAEDDDDEDEFQETHEGIDQETPSEEDGSDEDDDNQEQPRAGGVTGLVKGWLGI